MGSKKYRRTSDFSAPHKAVLDRLGNRAVPINEASKGFTIPKWIGHSPRADVRAWARDKYSHVPEAAKTSNEGWRYSHYKFPKERKPMVSDMMRDLAILLVASLTLDEPIFVFVEDAAFYFNQLGYAPEELWKSTLLVNAREGDVAHGGESFRPGQIVFISEKRLGFGTFASSNIAQRFSNALVGWTLEEFDKLEADAMPDEDDGRWSAWVETRRPLDERCRQQRPKKAKEALTDCVQTRLAILKMYTDDPLAGVVGVKRALRLLRAWRTVTSSVNLEMAGAEKRQIGGHVEWIGVGILAAIALVVVPKNKLLRARDALARTRAGTITFGEYRALVGLLEHIRFVAQLGAHMTGHLYGPHRRHIRDAERGPNELVVADEPMARTLDEWLVVVMRCAGAVVTIVFVKGARERLMDARAVVAGSSDAAGDGRGSPGIGGYIHGFY